MIQFLRDDLNVNIKLKKKWNSHHPFGVSSSSRCTSVPGEQCGGSQFLGSRASLGAVGRALRPVTVTGCFGAPSESPFLHLRGGLSGLLGQPFVSDFCPSRRDLCEGRARLSSLVPCSHLAWAP